MEYWIYHITTSTPYIFGSVPPLAKYIGVEKHVLERQFSRLKKTDITVNGYRIVKLEPVRSLRLKNGA
jgi:hypothetical protein